MELNISEYILDAQSADADLRRRGVLHLKELQKQDFSRYLLSLSEELLDEGDGTSDYRTLVGILFKNCLDAISKDNLHKEWESLDVSRKRNIQEALLRSLGSPLGKAVAQIIAEVASLSIPGKEWPGLIDHLLRNMAQEGKDHASLRQATMQSVGYVFEGLSHNALAQYEVDRIVKAVVQAMRCSEEVSVRRAATTALYNTLWKKFKIKIEWDPIMEAVFTATADVDFELKKGAFECLVSISSAHYEVLGPYMPELFEVTTNAMMYEGEDVALRAVQVWSCICDEEIKLTDSSRAHSQFIQKCTRSLVDMLLETLGENIIPKKGENTLKNKSGILSKAAGTCLGLVGRVVGDSIVALVMPFVHVELIQCNAESHAAGVFALGSILEGPSVKTLSPKLNTVFYWLLTLMRDKDSHVKGVTVWTLSRIFELLRSPDSGFPFISADLLKKIIRVLLESLNDPPEFAEKVCEVLSHLVQGYENIQGITSELTFEITTSLIATAERTDAYVSMLRSAAYKTLNEVVRCSNLSETSETITQLLDTVLGKLQSDDLLAFFCGVLKVIIRKLCSKKDTKQSVLDAAEKIVISLIKVLDHPNITVHKQAMLATGALVYAMGPKFNQHMPRFVKYVQKGLQTSVDSQVLIVSVGLVSELCQASGDKMSPHLVEIMELLEHHLSKSDLDRSVKPPIILCFGDMAHACDSRVSFQKYVSKVTPVLQEAVKDYKEIDANDDEKMEYGNELKRSIFGAYSGILQRPEADLMLPHADDLWNFIQVVIEDKHSDETVVMAATKALRAYAHALESHSKEDDLKVIRGFIEKCNQSGDKQLLKNANLMQESIDQKGP